MLPIEKQLTSMTSKTKWRPLWLLSRSFLNFPPLCQMYAAASADRQAQLEALQKMGIAPFLKSLFTILCTESASIVGWTKDGNAFEVRDLKALSCEILPKYFRHGKFSSFQRQLNYFGFKKLTKSHANICTYIREHFVRDNPSGMFLIKRKTNGTRMRVNSMDHHHHHHHHSPHLQHHHHPMDPHHPHQVLPSPFMQPHHAPAPHPHHTTSALLKLQSIPYDLTTYTPEQHSIPGAAAADTGASPTTTTHTNGWEPHRFESSGTVSSADPYSTYPQQPYLDQFSSSFKHHHDPWMTTKPISTSRDQYSAAENLSNNDLLALRDAVSILCGSPSICTPGDDVSND